MLHDVREPANDMIGIVRIDLAEVIKPRLNIIGIAKGDRRRPVKVEHAGARVFEPSTVRD